MTRTHLTSFGDVRSFFHSEHDKDGDTFRWLYDQVLKAHHTKTHHDAVEQEWLPYILKELESWDDAARYIYECVDEDEDAPLSDRFFTESSPVYAMIRRLNVEEWNSHGAPKTLEALAKAPDLHHITALEYSGFSRQYTSRLLEEHLDMYLNRADNWRPRQLTLRIYDLTPEHIAVLARHPLLETLEGLELPSNFHIGPEHVFELAKSPHLTQLKHFIWGSSMQELSYTQAVGSNERRNFLTPRDTLLLREYLPDLERLIDFYPERSIEQIERNKTRLELPSHTTKEKLERALKPFRQSAWPLDRSDRASGGFYAELDSAQFDAEGENWVPSSISEEIARLESWAYVYVLGTRQRHGGLQSAFNEHGELIEPLVFRSHCLPDHQRTFVDYHPEYQGQYFIQTLFAESGLVLIEDEDTHHLILLPDAERPSRNHLVDIFEALRRSEEIYGGNYAEYLCTFEDQMSERVSGEALRGALSWKEERHRFDRHGNLPDAHTQQGFQFQGDLLPFCRELERYGLELVTKSLDTYMAFIQVKQDT